MKIRSLIVAFLLLFCLNANSQNLTAISINLYTYHNGVRDLETGCASFYDPIWSDSVNLDDARVLSNPLENIAILRNRVLLAGEKRVTFDTIPLRLWGLRNNFYELQIFTRNISNAYLEVIDSNKLYPIVDTFVYRIYTHSVTTCDTVKNYRIIYLSVLSIHPDPIREIIKKERVLKVYPNPANDIVNIEMKEMPIGKYNITFYGFNFQKSLQINHLHNGSESINIKSLLPGLYHLVIEDDMRNKFTSSILKN